MQTVTIILLKVLLPTYINQLKKKKKTRLKHTLYLIYEAKWLSVQPPPNKAKGSLIVNCNTCSAVSHARWKPYEFFVTHTIIYKISHTHLKQTKEKKTPTGIKIFSNSWERLHKFEWCEYKLGTSLPKPCLITEE